MESRTNQNIDAARNYATLTAVVLKQLRERSDDATWAATIGKHLAMRLVTRDLIGTNEIAILSLKDQLSELRHNPELLLSFSEGILDTLGKFSELVETESNQAS